MSERFIGRQHNFNQTSTGTQLRPDTVGADFGGEKLRYHIDNDPDHTVHHKASIALELLIKGQKGSLSLYPPDVQEFMKKSIAMQRKELNRLKGLINHYHRDQGVQGK